MPTDAVVSAAGMMPDEKLLRRVLGGDTGLFEVIMRR